MDNTFWKEEINEFWRIELAKILVFICFGFIIGQAWNLYNVVTEFPIDTSNVIHVEKKVTPQIYWASFYNYSLAGYPDYGLTHATAASMDYPRGTILKVTGLDSSKSVIVKITDYGPQPCLEENNYQQSGSPEKCIERQIDLSTYAYRQICSIPRGLCQVTIEKL